MTIQQQQVQTHRILYMRALGRACGLEREREREGERERERERVSAV